MAYIAGRGNSAAKLMVIGEQPTPDDERAGMAFSGKAGLMVKAYLQEAGIHPDECYYTYVLKESRKMEDPKERQVIIEKYGPQLQKEVDALKPNAILALGNGALQACTGFRGITQYRGSVMPSRFGPKCIASMHPYSLRMRDEDGKQLSWSSSIYIRWDFERAVEHSKSKKLRTPERNLITAYDSLDLHRFIRNNEGKKYVSVDIETHKTFPVCISLAYSKYSAISVPLLNVPGKGDPKRLFSPREQADIWKMVAKVLADPMVLKIGQNYKFDERLLERCLNDTVDIGLVTNGFFFDTGLAFRTLFPEFPAKLEFIASVLTEEPYYKEEGKGYNPKKDSMRRLLAYNAKDAAVTFEVFERLVEEMQVECWPGYKVIDFFFDRVMPLHPFYSRIEKRGMLRDDFQHKFLLAKYMDMRNDKQQELDYAASEFWPDKEAKKVKSKKTGEVRFVKFNTQSNSAKGDMPRLVFDKMLCPRRKGTDEKTLDALTRNVVQDKRRKDILGLISETRKVSKVIGTYVNAKVDHRGRFLTGCRIQLETGRSATSILKSPVFTEAYGLAFQTITKHGEYGSDLRLMMIPDPGYVFFEIDQSQAEARVVALLGNDFNLMKMFDYKVDIHRVSTAQVGYSGLNSDKLTQFLRSLDDGECWRLAKEINSELKVAIDGETRQVGKKARHASNYDMGKREASLQLGCSEWAAGEYLDKIHRANPNTRKVFHHDIVESLNKNDRIQVSPHGRRRQFFNQWGSELFKEAYANLPQATVSDQTKFAMVEVERQFPWIQTVVEAHDAFMCLCPIAVGEQYPFKHLDKLRSVAKEEMEKPIDFKHCSLSRGTIIIPSECQIAERSWKEMRSYD